jgi:pimeloyl-ACP methyl ester carboxylesterase
MMWALGVIGGIIGLVAISHLVEVLRPKPRPSATLIWAPDIAVQYVTVAGMTLRYIAAGTGEPVVLLHTLRTQLDMFQKVIPELSRRCRVYALDFPGHGFSDIPVAEYSVELFVRATSAFLAALDIVGATIVGESIGGTVALLLAARHDVHVREVVAVNPYDYDGGRGLRRSSAIANLLFAVNDTPVLGGTLMRLRSYLLLKHILRGGVANHAALPNELAHEIYRVGNRPGHYRAFMSLIRHWPEWARAREEYARITVPVLLLYGDRDWSRPDERESTRRAIPGARTTVVKGAGHFLSLDAPRELLDAVLGQVGRHSSGKSATDR